MAASVTQPEMTELDSSRLTSDPANALLQSQSATSSKHDEAILSSNDQQEALTLATTRPADSTSTLPASAGAAMYPISSTGNQDGAVRGANNGDDNVTKLEGGEITTPAASTHHAAVEDSNNDVKSESTEKDPPITTVTSSNGAERESQEKGDQVTLELLLLSGSRRQFTFKTSSTVSEVLAWTFKDWPSEWEEQKPRELSQLRLLYRGQFLDGSSKLATHVAEDSAVTVMHLTIRPGETNESIKPKRKETASDKAATTDTHSGGCCSSCVIS